MPKLPLKVSDIEDVERIQTGGWMFLWCCDCGLRHTINYEVERGKKPQDDKIAIRLTDDRWATAARKKLKRLERDG